MERFFSGIHRAEKAADTFSGEQEIGKTSGRMAAPLRGALSVLIEH